MDPTGFERLIHRVASVSEPAARVRLLLEQLEALTAEEHEAFEQQLVREASLRAPQAQTVLLAWAEAEAERAAVLQGELAAPEADWGTGRPLTLGERKSLARRTDRRLLERALKDPHPAVIAEVLLNPKLTEADVARACADGKVKPRTIARILAAPRWASRVSVRSSIALNPATPERLALCLVPLLSRAELREIAGDARIAAAVRLRAFEILRRLPPTPEPADTGH
jgi:hypothetical protein